MNICDWFWIFKNCQTKTRYIMYIVFLIWFNKIQISWFCQILWFFLISWFYFPCTGALTLGKKSRRVTVTIGPVSRKVKVLHIRILLHSGSPSSLQTALALTEEVRGWLPHTGNVWWVHMQGLIWLKHLILHVLLVFLHMPFVFQLCTDGANPEVLCLKGHILLKLNRADEVEVIILQGKKRIIIKNNSYR